MTDATESSGQLGKPQFEELIRRFESLGSSVEEVWNQLRTATQRNQELLEQLENLNDEAVTIAPTPEEHSAIVVQPGDVYKQLLSVYRTTRTDLALAANDCFEDLDFRLAGEPPEMAAEAKSILQEFRTEVVTALPEFSTDDPPVNRPEVLTPFLRGIKGLVARGLMLLRRLYSEPQLPASGVQPVREPQESASAHVVPKRPRGTRPNLTRHSSITAIVKEMESRGVDWKTDAGLHEVCERLDDPRESEAEGMPDRVSVPNSWKKWRGAPAMSWTRALEYRPELVTKAIEYSLKYCQTRP